jgi:hypothetical protein
VSRGICGDPLRTAFSSLKRESADRSTGLVWALEDLNL